MVGVPYAEENMMIYTDAIQECDRRSDGRIDHRWTDRENYYINIAITNVLVGITLKAKRQASFTLAC